MNKYLNKTIRDIIEEENKIKELIKIKARRGMIHYTFGVNSYYTFRGVMKDKYIDDCKKYHL